MCVITYTNRLQTIIISSHGQAAQVVELDFSENHNYNRSITSIPLQCVQEHLYLTGGRKARPREQVAVAVVKSHDVHTDIQKARPCWYCTNLVILDMYICDVCGHEQLRNDNDAQ